MAKTETNMRRSKPQVAMPPALPAALLALISPPLLAFGVDTGFDDISLRWDNTFKYSNAFRLKQQSGKLIGDPNGDDGDRNFDRGLISNRADLLSELDVGYKDYGARLSGATWYDTVYNRSNDNDSPTTVNQGSVAYDHFPRTTERLHGRKVELLDAFVHGKGTVGGTRWGFRAGQFAQQWGETLFFGTNGIAGAMAPMDVIKALSVPGTQFKELIRPVPQFSLSFQPDQNLLISAYYQVDWEATRLPGAGSYFGNDLFDKGGERFLFGHLAAPGLMPPNALYLERARDLKPKDGGQGGVEVRFRLPNGMTDFGLYAIRYHDKTPQLYVRPGIDADGQSRIGRYSLAYAQGVEAYGASANRTFGNLNLAGEFSMRRHTPLVNDGITLAPEQRPRRGHPFYPVGDSLHGNLSTMWTLPVSRLFKEASLLGELAWNDRLHIDKNPGALAANATRQALTMRFSFTPTYRQVLSGLDLDVPFTIGYSPEGTSSVVSAFGQERGGDVSLGLNATYLAVWKATFNVTHFFGPEDLASDAMGHLTFKQSFKDRDFIALSIQRTF